MEIDLLRSFAVLLMIIYHLAYDLAMFHGWNIDPLSGGWWLLARFTATLFLLLVGISFSISWHRTRPTQLSGIHAYQKYLRRGLLIIACGMLVSLVTYVFDPSSYVRFGILHLIGTGTILLPLLMWTRRPGGASLQMIVGIVCIIIGWIIRGRTAPTFLLIPLGMPPPDFVTIDYFPLFPWFGVMVMGLAMGRWVYVPGTRRADGASLRMTTGWRALTLPGRYALIIYLLHQPLLLAILYIAQKMLLVSSFLVTRSTA